MLTPKRAPAESTIRRTLQRLDAVASPSVVNCSSASVIRPAPFPIHSPNRCAGSCRVGRGDGWLFPGKNPGQPLTHRSLFLKLRRLGFPLGEARVSALRQLVLQAPAPVIAAALGVHHTTRQANNAGIT